MTTAQLHYWAVKHAGRDDAIRVEHCRTPQQAVVAAFGPVVGTPTNRYAGWWAKDLGTRNIGHTSDKTLRAWLSDPSGWFRVGSAPP